MQPKKKLVLLFILTGVTAALTLVYFNLPDKQRPALPKLRIQRSKADVVGSVKAVERVKSSKRVSLPTKADLPSTLRPQPKLLP